MLSYLFPGQGSQCQYMGQCLFDYYPELTDSTNDILGYSIKSLCTTDEPHRLNQTEFTQPALYVVSVMSYLRKMEEIGQEPDYLAGHSVGEFGALFASGAVSFTDGLKMVKKRGELMAKAQGGSMAAILGLAYEDVLACLQKNQLDMIDIANINDPTQIVISGLNGDINRAQPFFEKSGAIFIPLKTSGAFHSRRMRPAQIEFEDYLNQFEFDDFRIPVISNVHAQPYQTNHINQTVVKQTLAKQITHPVRWFQSIQYLLDQGCWRFIEVGPGNVLTKLVSRIQTHYFDHQKTQLTQVDLLSMQTAMKRTIVNKQVDDWNNTWSVGTIVKANGLDGVLQTRTKAKTMFGQHAAVYVEGNQGYLSLDDIRVSH